MSTFIKPLDKRITETAISSTDAKAVAMNMLSDSTMKHVSATSSVYES